MRGLRQTFPEDAVLATKGTESMIPSVSPKRRAGFSLSALAVLTGGLVLAAPLSATAAPSAANFSIAVSDATVDVGDTIDVTVSATTAADVYAYELALGFDPAVLQYVDGSAATEISGVNSATVSGETLEFVHTKLGTSPSATGDLTLATLSFEAIGSGSGALTLDVELVGADAASLTFADAATASIDVAALPGTPPSTSTPTPPALPGSPGSPAGEDAEPVSSPGRDNLSETGADVTPWPIVGAALAMLLGAALLIGRRRARAQQQ